MESANVSRKSAAKKSKHVVATVAEVPLPYVISYFWLEPRAFFP